MDFMNEGPFGILYKPLRRVREVPGRAGRRRWGCLMKEAGLDEVIASGLSAMKISDTVVGVGFVGAGALIFAAHA